MYCPSCHAEYRSGFEECAHCKVSLVETLKVAAISDDEADDAMQVGVVAEPGEESMQEIKGTVYDLSRVFPIETALVLRDRLTNDGVPVLLVAVDEEFPDQRPHFEVRVRPVDHAKAESQLQAWWGTLVEKRDTAAQGSAETVENCPACNAHVPMAAEECPDCGLYVGAGEDDDSEADEAEA